MIGTGVTSELLPERYHRLRDAQSYTDLRRVLDRNGKYYIGGICGRSCRKPNGTRKRDGDGRYAEDGFPKRKTTVAVLSQRASKNFGQLGQQKVEEHDGKVFNCVRQCKQDSRILTSSGERGLSSLGKSGKGYYCVSIQWHLDYLSECANRAEKLKERFVEQKVLCPKLKTVIKVQRSQSEEIDREGVLHELFPQRTAIRNIIMDNQDLRLYQEKSKKLENIIDEFYRLKLEAGDIKRDAIPKIILTDYSSCNTQYSEHFVNSESIPVLNNNKKYFSKDTEGVYRNSDNHLNNNSNNHGCFLQPHFIDPSLGNQLDIPTLNGYQSEARPP